MMDKYRKTIDKNNNISLIANKAPEFKTDNENQ
jgi:hypothetical protein